MLYLTLHTYHCFSPDILLEDLDDPGFGCKGTAGRHLKAVEMDSTNYIQQPGG